MRKKLLRPALTGLAMSVLLTAGVPAWAQEDISSIRGAFLREEYETVVRETGREMGRGGAEDELLYLRGVSALKLRDWDLARSALTRLVEEHPVSPWTPQGWLALGDSWMGAGRPERALAVYGKVIRERRAGDLAPQALSRLGKAQRELGLWQEARSSLEQVTRAAPDSAEAAQAREMLGREDFFFTVQVGSFVTRPNADRLAQELQRRGYPAEVSEAVMDGKIFHRVRIGRFAKRSEAEDEARRLSGDGFPARIFP